MRGGATIKGKQAAVQEGQFLQFLRSVGYKDELPPSTVAWLESAPVFRFLATKLSSSNFITPEQEQEYNELMLARGPDASLYDAVDGFSSDADSDSGDCGGASTRDHQRETDPFLADLSDAEVARQLEVEEARHAQLKQQHAALQAACTALEAANRQQAQSQGPKYFELNAKAADQLTAANLEAQQVAEAIDGVLQQLQGVCGELLGLCSGPQQWLLAAADRSGYRQVDDRINAQHLRGVQVLDVGDVTLELHHPASPPAASPLGLATAAAAAKAAGGLQLAAAAAVASGGGFATPRGMMGGQLPGTPRQQVAGQSLAEALAEAKSKRRAAHMARNDALTREMGRQQHAFELAHKRHMQATLQEAGLRAQVAAAQQVRTHSGQYAVLLSQGPQAVQELQRQYAELQAAVTLLRVRGVNPLVEQVAQLNDCHIVVGDYDRHLAKMRYAMERKRAMLDSLLGRASLHLLLLLMCVEELRRLAALSGDLQGTAHLLEGHVEATGARLASCAAAVEALDTAQGLSNIQASDSFLCALLAAADGTLVLPQQQQQQQSGAQAAAAAASQEAGADDESVAGATPKPTQPPSSSYAGGSLLTPSYAPTASLADKLQALSDRLGSHTSQLHTLLDLLPAQLDQHKASAVRLHRTAFPPGQPMHSSGPLGGAAAGAGAAAGSVAGSTWGGSQSAAPSVRTSRHSVHSVGSGRSMGSSGLGLQHPQLLLVLPEVAEAAAAVQACLEALQNDSAKAIYKHNKWARALEGNKEHALEQQLVADFFTKPEAVAAALDAVRVQVEQMQRDQDLS